MIRAPSKDVAVVVVSTESLVNENIAPLQEQVCSHLEHSRKLVLDLRNVQFMDSAGCGALLGFFRRLRDLGGRFAVCHVRSPVRALFDLIRLTRVIDLFGSQEEALEAVAA